MRRSRRAATSSHAYEVRAASASCLRSKSGTLTTWAMGHWMSSTSNPCVGGQAVAGHAAARWSLVYALAARRAPEKLLNLLGASPGKGHAGASMAVVVDDHRAGHLLSFDPNLGARGTQADPMLDNGR